VGELMGATYLCVIGCLSECRHHLPCLVYMVDETHPHQKRHIAVDEDGVTHEWVGKGTGRCCLSREGS
jgi:hypothetical protein